jgi:hypothetical protein
MKTLTRTIIRGLLYIALPAMVMAKPEASSEWGTRLENSSQEELTGLLVQLEESFGTHPEYVESLRANLRVWVENAEARQVQNKMELPAAEVILARN